ncbi:hypothetical protein [Chitinophaga sp.]|uniref:hypothetical protein n=1 Tax=Chitinophaga sp. TaxID=1869181 RepID=UPI002F93316E
MKKKKCLKETTHRRTYNLVRKETYAICPRCHWHPTFWRWCWDHPYIGMTYTDDGTNKPYALRFKNHPNWKAVSKNRKQWMKKRFLEDRTINPDGCLRIVYGW